MRKHVSITIFGKVHNTGFRYSAVEKALQWNLVGVVKDYEVDKVQIEVEGELADLQNFLKWCHVGPEGAQIKKVDYQSTEQLENYESFQAEWFT